MLTPSHAVVRTKNPDGSFTLDIAEMTLTSPRRRATDDTFIPTYSDCHATEQEMLKAMREELAEMIAATFRGIVDEEDLA